jgi:transcriptional regulator with XRE-family HTH domain
MDDPITGSWQNEHMAGQRTTPKDLLSQRLAEAIRATGRYRLRSDRGPVPHGELPGTSQLARDCGLEQSTVQRYVDGKRDTGDLVNSMNILADLARQLDVEFEWLAVGTGPRQRRPKIEDPVSPAVIRRMLSEELDARGLGSGPESSSRPSKRPCNSQLDARDVGYEDGQSESSPRPSQKPRRDP